MLFANYVKGTGIPSLQGLCHLRYTYSYTDKKLYVNSYLALPDKSYTKLPVRIASIISSDRFSYSCADILLTSDSRIAPEPSLVSGLLRELRESTDLAASLSVFFFFLVLIFLSDLYKADKNITTKKKTKTTDKDAARSVNARNSRSKPDTSDGSKAILESDVQKMSAQEYEKMSDDIMEAIRTGTFVYDISVNAR